MSRSYFDNLAGIRGVAAAAVYLRLRRFVERFFVMDTLGLPGRSGPMSLPTDLYTAREIVNLSLGDIKKSLFMLSGMLDINGPLWSLYIEAKAYVLFACALALITRRSILQKLVLATIFFYVSKAGIELNPGFGRYSAIWLIGGLAYYIWNVRYGYIGNRLLICAVMVVVAEICNFAKDGATLWDAACDVLIAVIVSWLLFKVRVRVPSSKRLDGCSYSLYVTHFPIILLAESLLISTGSVSVGTAIGVAAASAAASAGIALVGGAIEARKSTVERGLLSMLERLRCLRIKPS